jgi:hypothetical protein
MSAVVVVVSGEGDGFVVLEDMGICGEQKPLGMRSSPPRRAPDEADGASAALLCRDAVYCWPGAAFCGPGAGFCGPVWPGGFCDGASAGFV